jgi:two-component sensor histidine kinase
MNARFNEPSHLPQPLKWEESPDFDVFDSILMRDICGEFSEPIQTLLISYEQLRQRGDMTDAQKANFLDSLRGELKSLLSAVKEGYDNL